MRHDFAKIRPEPLLEKKPAQTPPAWSMMITGVVVGIALGVFGSVLLYLSGHVPPLNTSPAGPATSPMAADAGAGNEAIAAGDGEGLQLEFYHELANYEVAVEATPVELHEERRNQPMDVSYMLQSGAFQQRELADREMARQQALGLDVSVKVEALTGRTLYLVQSGPYTTQAQLDAAETILRHNAIPTLRTRVQ